MSVGAAVSAATGNACICVEHLEPAISSHPPNAKAAAVVLRPFQTTSECIPATGEKPQSLSNGFFSPDCPVSPLAGQWGAALLWQNRLPPPTRALCQHPHPMPCAEQLCWRGHWWHSGWRRSVAPTLSLTRPNNGMWQIPCTSKCRLSCWSVLTQASYWLSRVPPERLWPSGRRQCGTSEL